MVEGLGVRRAAKRDANEPGIVQALEAAGCDVLRATDVDLIVGRANQNYLLECKLPSERKRLRPIQKRLRDQWRGQYAIVTTPEEALRAVGLRYSARGFYVREDGVTLTWRVVCTDSVP